MLNPPPPTFMLLPADPLTVALVKLDRKHPPRLLESGTSCGRSPALVVKLPAESAPESVIDEGLNPAPDKLPVVVIRRFPAS